MIVPASSPSLKLSLFYLWLQKWADGGLTNNLPIPPFGHTLLISPFSGKNNHICPEDESQGITDITFHNMNIYVNRENLQRELQIFIPPKRGGIEIIQKGYDDTLRFLQREKLCDYSPWQWCNIVAFVVVSNIVYKVITSCRVKLRILKFHTTLLRQFCHNFENTSEILLILNLCYKQC